MTGVPCKFVLELDDVASGYPSIKVDFVYYCEEEKEATQQDVVFF